MSYGNANTPPIEGVKKLSEFVFKPGGGGSRSSFLGSIPSSPSGSLKAETPSSSPKTSTLPSPASIPPHAPIQLAQPPAAHVRPPAPAPPTGGRPPAPAPPTGARPPAPSPPTGARPPAPAPPTGARPPAPSPPTGARPPAPSPPTGRRPPAPAPPVSSAHSQGRAIYDYQAHRPDELSISIGEEFIVESKGQDGWWYVNMNGIKGFIPGNYVTEIAGASAHITRDPNATLVNTVFEVALPGFLKMDPELDIRKEQAIGEGGIAQVFRGVILNPEVKRSRNNNNPEIAIKEIHAVPGFTPEERIVSFHQEIRIMWSVAHHPNILKLVGYCDVPSIIVTELLEADLANLIKKRPLILSSALISKIAAQIAYGMEEIHKNWIIHRDLKSSNILVQNIDHPDKMRIAICDFGLAKSEHDEGLVNQKKIDVTGCSPHYTSPEVFRRIDMIKKDLRNNPPKPSFEEEKKGDVFSFGVILWELLNQKKAWQGMKLEEIKDQVINGKRMKIEKNLGNDSFLKMLVGMMESCWDQSWQKRPSFEEISKKLITYR